MDEASNGYIQYYLYECTFSLGEILPRSKGLIFGRRGDLKEFIYRV